MGKIGWNIFYSRTTSYKNVLIFRYCEKVTKFERITQLFSNYLVMSKDRWRFFSNFCGLLRILNFNSIFIHHLCFCFLEIIINFLWKQGFIKMRILLQKQLCLLKRWLCGIRILGQKWLVSTLLKVWGTIMSRTAYIVVRASAWGFT